MADFLNIFRPDRWLALEVGDDATDNTHYVIRVRTEVVVPRYGSGPHFVVLQQIRINEHTQLCAVTKGRHATVGLGNLLELTDR